MPNNPRQNTKQNLNTIVTELIKAQDKVVIVAQPYKKVHPDYYSAFEDIVKQIELVKEMVEYLNNKI